MNMSNPWDDCPDLWKSEKHFCQWLRSQTRRIWSRHPVKNRYCSKHTVAAESIKGFKQKFPRAKKARQCAMCKEWYPPTQTEVDHIHPAGSFDCVKTYHIWVERLLVLGFDDMRILCKPCHLKVTLAEKFKCKLEDVWAYQEVAAFNKLKAKEARKKMEEYGLPSDKSLTQLKAIFKQYMMEKIK